MEGEGKNVVVSGDEGNRLAAVREYLQNGEQPTDGLVLATRVYGPCRYVIAKGSGGLIHWALRVTDSGRLYRTDAAHVIAMEKMSRRRRRPRRSSINLTRDARSDPQPGDILRGDDKIRCVIKRDGDVLICETLGRRYRMLVDSWRKWCGKSSAIVS